MKKGILMGLVICLLVSALVGCTKEAAEPALAPTSTPAQSPETEPAEVPVTRTVVDDRGVAVEIPAEVNRIVTVCIPYAQVVWALDSSGERLVGMHESAKVAVENSLLGEMAPELLEVESGFTELGSFVVNVEELLKLEPDVVFQWTDQDKEIEKMEAAGLTVIGATNQRGLDEVPHRIELVGKVLGEEQRAAELIADYNETLDTIGTRVADLSEDDKPVVLHIHNLEPLQARYYPWYDAAGARSPLTKNSNVNMEQVLAWNPDIIYIGNFCDYVPDDLLQNRVEGQDWSQVEAVKNGQVYKIPLGTYRWEPWNAESALLMWWVAKVQHPDLFSDYTVEEKLKDFYTKFYGYDLSDAEVEWILNPIPHKGA